MNDLPKLGTSHSTFTKNASIQADTGRQYVRANQIARSNRTKTPLIDISLATWWRWVAAGRAPQPKRLSPGTTVWDLSEVLAFLRAEKTRSEISNHSVRKNHRS